MGCYKIIVVVLMALAGAVAGHAPQSPVAAVGTSHIAERPGSFAAPDAAAANDHDHCCITSGAHHIVCPDRPQHRDTACFEKCNSMAAQRDAVPVVNETRPSRWDPAPIADLHQPMLAADPAGETSKVEDRSRAAAAHLFLTNLSLRI